MTREEMIQLLILDCLEHEGDQQRYLWLQNILENGFCGFANMSDEQLSRKVWSSSAKTAPRTPHIEADSNDWGDESAEDARMLIQDYTLDHLQHNLS